MIRIIAMIIDILVPFGVLLRKSDQLELFDRWPEVLLRFLPMTFLMFWLFTFIPVFGGLIYMLVFVPLSIRLNTPVSVSIGSRVFLQELLTYLTVILIGLGGIRSFVGHTLLADQVATDIGWAPGSPFQLELAFFSLGSGMAALSAIWIRGHLITGLVLSKSIFWYGAAYTHIQDVILNQNYSSFNIGAPLIGDIIYPTLMLFLLFKVNTIKSGAID